MRINWIVYLICCVSVFAADSQAFRITSVSLNGVTIDVGSDAGARRGMAGTVYYNIQVRGETKKVRIARFTILSVTPSSSDAVIDESTERVLPGYFIEINIALVPKINKANGGQESKPMQVPLNGVGRLRVTTDPPNANVFVDDRKIASAGESIEVKVGKHAVKINTPGFVDLTDTIIVASNELTEKHFKLDLAVRKKGTILITTDPPGADLFCEGQLLGKAGQAIIKEAGNFAITIQAPQYYQKTVTLEVAADSRIERNYSLTPIDYQVPDSVASRILEVGQGGQFALILDTMRSGVISFDPALFDNLDDRLAGVAIERFEVLGPIGLRGGRIGTSDFRVAVVNSQKILESSIRGAQALRTLQALNGELEAKVAAGQLTNEAVQVQLQQRQAVLLEVIRYEVRDIIDRLVKLNKIAVTFDIARSGIIRHDNGMDITAEVIESLDTEKYDPSLIPNLPLGVRIYLVDSQRLFEESLLGKQAASQLGQKGKELAASVARKKITQQDADAQWRTFQASIYQKVRTDMLDRIDKLIAYYGWRAVILDLKSSHIQYCDPQFEMTNMVLDWLNK
jgi:hypothetical protein